MSKNDKRTISVRGKVDYNEYINYLSTKSDDEIKEVMYTKQ